MNVVYIFVAASLFFASPSFAATKPDVKVLSELPENEIDIGRAALLLAQEIFPEIDVDAYSAKIDEIVVEVQKLSRGSQDPDYRVRALNTYLYKIFGMQYDLEDPYVKDIRNRYMNGILDTRKG